MGDFGAGVRSTNIFEALNQPSKGAKDSTEKAPAKSAEKKAKKAEAVKAAAPQAAPKTAVRTGNKRGGLANKGTRPGSARPGTTDNRGKRTYDRQSEQGFQKNHGNARKGGLNQGGNTDLKAEAVTATEEFNAGAKDAGLAPTEGKDATDAKVEVKEPEVPDLRKTLAQHEAEIAARAVSGDVLTARAVVVGKEFKTGAPPKKNKSDKESLFSDVKADAEAKKAAESAKDAKPAKKAGKESKAKVAAAPAPKPTKIVLDEFNDKVKPPARAEPKAPREDAKPAAAGAEAAKTGGAARGGRGGARGGRGGARGGRGGRGAPIDLSAFPVLGATKA